MNPRNEAYQSHPGSRSAYGRNQRSDTRNVPYSSQRVMVEDSFRFSNRQQERGGQRPSDTGRSQEASYGAPAQQRQKRDIAGAADNAGYQRANPSSSEYANRRRSSAGAQASAPRGGGAGAYGRNASGRSDEAMRNRRGASSQRSARQAQPSRARDDIFVEKSMTGRKRISGRSNSFGGGSQGFSSGPRFAKKSLVIRVVIAVLVIAAVVFAITRFVSCSSQPSQQPSSKTTVAEQNYEPAVSAELLAQVNAADLSGFLDDEEISALKNKAQTNADVAWIVANSAQYEQYGTETHAKLFRLVLSDENSINFVRYYPDKVGTDALGPETLTNKTAPMAFYYQWDTAWAYMNYGDSSLGMNGCGPTCMAMIASAILGDSSITPYSMAKLIIEQGYITEGDGTDADVFPEIATMLGFYGNETYAHYDTMKEALEKGQYLILNVGPGDFTRGGHFIVVEKLDGDGTVVVHDPYSTVNSSKKWDLESVAGQTKRTFVFE